MMLRVMFYFFYLRPNAHTTYRQNYTAHSFLSTKRDKSEGVEEVELKKIKILQYCNSSWDPAWKTGDVCVAHAYVFVEYHFQRRNKISLFRKTKNNLHAYLHADGDIMMRVSARYVSMRPQRTDQIIRKCYSTSIPSF